MNLSEGAYAVLKRDVFLAALKLLSGIVVARLLGPTGMGVWIILMLIPVCADALARLNLENGAVYVLGRRRYRVGEVAFTLPIVAIACAAAFIGATLVILDTISPYVFKGASVDRRLVYLTLAVIPLQFLGLNNAYLLIHAEDISSYNRLTLLRDALGCVLGIVLMAAFGLGVTGLVIGVLVGAA